MRPDRFATTHWSVVLAAGRGASADAQAALATLCETYWGPVYAYVRRSGCEDDAARDLTQAFFARLLDKKAVQSADPIRGRFRSFLLASVRNFLANERKAAARVKRGGDVPHLSLEFESEERRYRLEPADHETPERVYERRWALATLQAAFDRVSEEYRSSGRGELFESLQSFLDGSDPGSYKDLAKALESTEGALRVAVHRMRRTFQTAVREIVESTVEHPEEMEAELRHLKNALAR